MARRFGGYNPNQANSSFDNSGRLIVKEDIRKDWYVYRVTNHTIFKPYPVFDEMGNPCEPRNDNPENPESWDAYLPVSCEIAPIVTYAGRGGALEFVDVCSDIERYSNGEALRTPYSLFISAMKKLSPDRNNVVQAGFTPESLKLLLKHIPYAAPTVLMRGAILMSSGKVPNGKGAVSGVMFKTLFAITQRGARMNFVAKYNEPLDPSVPIGSRNFVLMNLAAPNPEVLDFRKDPAAPQNSAHSVMRTASQNYIQAAAQFFSLQSNDPREYYAKIRDMYGIYPYVGDCLNVMTVEEMVNAMRSYYPPCLVWYGLRDTPYASLFDSVARQLAETEDPSMASLFGRQPAVNTQVYSNAPQYQQPQYQQAPNNQPQYTQQPPPNIPPQRQPNIANAPTGGFQQPQYTQQPPPNHPAYQQPAAQFTQPDQIPMGNAPQQPVSGMPPAGFNDSFDPQEEDPDMQTLRNKFGM